jgi:hypothetical protein
MDINENIQSSQEALITAGRYELVDFLCIEYITIIKGEYIYVLLLSMCGFYIG